MAASASRFGINTYSYIFDYTAGECMRHLAGQGYRNFELMMYPGHLWATDMDAATRRDLRRIAEEADLEIVSLNMPNVDINVAAAAAEMRAYSLGMVEDLVRLAGDLGVRGVVFGPGKANPLFPMPRERMVSHFFTALDRLIPAAERAGTQLWLENMSFAFIPDAEGLMQALDDFGAAADDVAICYDVANAHFISEDPCEGLRRVRDRLKLVHLSDTTKRVYRHDAVGKGDVQFAAVPPVLAEIGHDELPMLEIISPDADPDVEIADSVCRLVEMGWN